MATTNIIILLIALLAVPILFLFLPKLSAGLMAPTYEREVRTLIEGPNAQYNPQSLTSIQHRKDILGKLSKTQKTRQVSSRLTLEKKTPICSVEYLYVVISSLRTHPQRSYLYFY